MPSPEDADRIAIPEALPAVSRLDGDYDYDDFHAEEVVGQGGNATVRTASIHQGPDRSVVLKEPHVSNPPEAVVDRFRVEAEMWAKLDSHPHIVTVHGWGSDPHPWIALEYMDGGELTSWTGEWGLKQSLWTGVRVAAAIDHAHRNDVVHLDLKPGNILFRESPGRAWPVPKVADWGIAGLLRSGTANLEGLSPRYAAPEQFAVDRYGQPSAATDIYQLGVLLYELLVGIPPFDGPPRVLQNAVLEEEPPAPSGQNTALPTAVDDLLDPALAKDPADRYESISTFQLELEQLFNTATGQKPGLDDVSDVERSDQRLVAGTESVKRTEPTTNPYERALTLANEGFVRVNKRYFARRDPAPPLEAWRRGVTLADARAGRAVERVIEREDGCRAGLTELLIEELTAGTDHIVLGPPGSGKSTICKRVACKWFEEGTGPVFYRESNRSDRFGRPGSLAREITATDGHALVVVEDAVRPEAHAVFEFLELVEDHKTVTVLLDAREQEWRDATHGTDPFGDDPVTTAHETLEPIYVPRPDTHEHERFVHAVEAAADRPLDIDIEQLQEDVRQVAASETAAGEKRPGELFYLLHRLTALARDPLADDGPTTTLTDAVDDVHEQLAELGDAALDVGAGVNVLNAAGIGVYPELLHALVPEEPLVVDEALETLEGRVVFPHSTDWDAGKTAYPSIHEAWSTEFLVHYLAEGGETATRRRFSRVVTQMLSLADDPDRREQVRGALGGEAPFLTRIEQDPEEWASETVEAVYALGRERPKLAPLFGTEGRDSIKLPEACPPTVVEERPVWLGQMFLAGGYYDRAERAFERLPQDETNLAVERLLGLARIADEQGEYDKGAAYAQECLGLLSSGGRSLARARAHLQYGKAASGISDYNTAKEHYQAAVEGFETVGDHRRKALALNAIGVDAYRQRDYDRAREYLERSLDIKRELGDRRGKAESFDSLGLVAREQGAYAQAQEYHKRGLALAQELGDRHRQASNFNNIGIVSDLMGNHDRALEYFQRGLELYRELGDRRGELGALGNLGKVAQSRGEYDQAVDYFRQCLERARELGDQNAEATGLRNLGEVARIRGQYDRARDYFGQNLEISREIGDRQGEANGYKNLGVIALRQRDYNEARDRLVQALDIAQEIGHLREETTSLRGLGELARRRGEFALAQDYLDQALERVEDSGDQSIRGRIELSRARLALSQGDLAEARERAAAANEAVDEMNATHWMSRVHQLRGRIAAEAGDPDIARNHWRRALDTAEIAGASQDALVTLESLVEICRETGDKTCAKQWQRQAEKALARAPAVISDQHREWIEHA